MLTGAGVAFCAGADIIRRAQDTGGLEHGGGDTFRPAFERVLDAIVDHPAPVIAAVNGAALGAGMQLAVACDLRVVAPTAKIGIPAAKLGVLLSAPNIRRLAVLVGQGAARDILLTGRTMTADEAARGRVRATGRDDALAAGLELAGDIAELAPLSVQGHKHALNIVADATALDDSAIAEIRALEEGCVPERGPAGGPRGVRREARPELPRGVAQGLISGARSGRSRVVPAPSGAGRHQEQR